MKKKLTFLTKSEEQKRANDTLVRGTCFVTKVSLADKPYELVYHATKRLIPPKGLPLDVGCVVNNVETYFNVSNAAKGIPVTEKFI